ncbi:MAG: HAD family hydrolase [Kiritimatiellae bacterium]|nr:HAD family hydrolase [Kiritimatiellia bacterium]
MRIIWDWNGTLLDDVSAAVNALNRMLVSRNAKPITIDHYRSRFGFPVRPFYEELGVDLDKWDWDQICEDFHIFVSEEPQQIREDARTALELAKQLGFEQCILSALREDILEDALRKNGLRDYFDFVYGVDNLDGSSKLSRGKELFSAIGESAENSVLIGDTLHDAEVARELDIGCVLVSCGHQLAERLSAAGCRIEASITDAVKHVASLGSKE